MAERPAKKHKPSSSDDGEDELETRLAELRAKAGAEIPTWLRSILENASLDTSTKTYALEGFNKHEEKLKEQLKKKEEEYKGNLKKKEEEIKQYKETINKQGEKLEKFEKISTLTLIEKQPDLELVCTGNNSSHTGSSKHHTAKVKKFSVVTETIPKQCYGNDEVSSLLHLFSQAGKHNSSQNKITADYHTESDVSQYVGAALRDAVDMVSKVVQKELHIRKEYSLFSDRPDHLAVMDSQARDPIMAVEDKKPFSGEPSDRVNGQILDYLMEMRAFGHQAPFVVLSTFEQSWLYCEEKETSIQIAMDGENRLKKAKTTVDGLVSPSKVPKEQEETTPSPPKLIDDHVPKIIGGGEAKSLFLGYGDRKVAVSEKIFSSKELVPLLFTALICALTQNPTRRVESMKSYAEGTKYSGQALMLNEKGYQWGELDFTVGERVHTVNSSRPQNLVRNTRAKAIPENTYFAIQPIGRGSTSKIFHAFNWLGKECVIKMYVKQWDAQDEMEVSELDEDTEPDIDEDRKMPPGNIKGKKAQAGKQKEKSFKEKSKEQARWKCKKEEKNWHLIYPELKDRVFYRELNDIPCVILPLLLPLSKEERTGAMDKIEECLNRFQEKGLKYEESDLRWRHVGRLVEDNEKKKIIMYDLADLEKAGENHVPGYLDILKNRLAGSGN